MTDTTTLIEAMRILSREIESGDGVANAAIAEAADRLEELQAKLDKCKAFFDFDSYWQKEPENSTEWVKSMDEGNKLWKSAKESCE